MLSDRSNILARGENSIYIWRKLIDLFLKSNEAKNNILSPLIQLVDIQNILVT